MIVESMVCLVLRCSRCNKAMQSDESEGDVHWASQADIAKEFHPAGRRDVCGWLRFGDRYLCPNCVTFDDETGDPIEDPTPLPAIEAAVVARAQASYRAPS